MVVESLCNSSRLTWNSRTAWTTTARVSEGMSASKRRSRQRPTRSSLSEGSWSGLEAEEFGDVAGGPLAEAVEGLARDEEVLEQEQQPGGGGDATAAVLAREMVAEDRVESESVEESVEDRQGTDGVGIEGAAGGAGDPAGPERRGVLRAGAGGLARHEPSPRCVGVERDHDGRRSAA